MYLFLECTQRLTCILISMEGHSYKHYLYPWNTGPDLTVQRQGTGRMASSAGH